MKGFYWGTGRVRCSFCGHTGHNITGCKSVNMFANLALEKLERIPDYVCVPSEIRALEEMKRREERKVNLQKKKRKPSRCSFCRSTDHKRPNCQELKDFRQLLYKANKNWKKTLKHAINEAGLGIGSLIKLQNSSQNDLLGIVTYIDCNNLNLFCGFDGDHKYRSNSVFEVMVGTDIIRVNFKAFRHLLGKGLLLEDYWYTMYDSPQVINPMTWEPDKDWLESEWDEVFNWFFNEINIKKLQRQGLMAYIKRWAEK